MNRGPLRILMVGDRLTQRGGIATLECLQMGSAPEHVKITHLATHDEGSRTFRVLFFTQSWLHLIWLVRRQQFDVVHIHQSGGGSLVRKTLVASVAQRAGLPIVLHGHAGRSDSTLRMFPALLQRRIVAVLGRADVVIALSRNWADWYHDALGVPYENIQVVHNPAPPVTQRTQRSHAAGKPVRLVSVSRLREDKGTYDLLHAYAALPHSLRRRSEIVLVGDGEIERTQQLARELGIADRVRLTGWLEGLELQSTLQSADVFVSPSHHEGIPLALLEAMAAGVAPVSTTVGGVPEIVDNGRTGMLVPAMQPAELTRALATLIEDDDLRNTVASAAQAAAALNDVDAYWGRVEMAYRAALGGRVDETSEDPKQISVVVPTFNRAVWLGDALDSLMNQATDRRFEYEIVVVDNNSSDHTATVVADAAARSRVPLRYCFEPVQGDGAARNHGIRAAEHDWLAFFDDDQIADPRWLLGLCDAVRDSGALLVGGAVGLALDHDERRRFGPVTRRDMLRESSPYARVQPYTDGDLPGTCNLLVAREVFTKVGLFDADLNGGSDHDFLRRSARSGVTAWFTPDAVVTHRVGTYRRTNEYFRRESRRNGWSLAQKTLSERGSLALAFECFARLGQATLINAPRLMFSRLRHDSADATDRRVLLWRTEGFIRRTAAQFIPEAWPQDGFLADHTFAGHDSQQVFDEA